MVLKEGEELPEALREVRPRDMGQELAAVMGLDLDRRPPYSQAEFLRLKDSPENSPRVSAALSLAGQLAQDVREMSRGRTTAVAAASNLISAAAGAGAAPQAERPDGGRQNRYRSGQRAEEIQSGSQGARRCPRRAF